MTKIAISTEGNNVSAHFGRCTQYSIFDVADNTIKAKTVVDTPEHQPGLLPAFLNEKGVTCVISGGMGPKAQSLFKEMNIEPIIGVSGNIDQVIAAYLNGTLEQGESQCNHGHGGHNGQCNH
jgi:predicted Fe-Mo cluster-binding NifX family protein